ncbi:MAG: zf-TFIIB domain-containing protein [Kofleriaceae bacterium]
MAALACPRCGVTLETAGYTERCTKCDGAWVHEDALVGMLQERTSALVFLPWQPRDKDQQRACPVCTQAMQTVNLEAVALDRCAEHGVWFDAHELAALLAAAKHFKATPHTDEPHAEHSGLLGAIAKLFGG